MKATCREVIDAVVRDGDEASGARAARHLDHCGSCAAQARARAAVRTAVLAEDDHLDDLTRTRVLARLGPAIDEVAARRAGRTPGRLVHWVWGAGVAVVAGAIVTTAWRLAAPPAATNPAAPPIAARAPAAVDRSGRVLTPYALEGAGKEAETGAAAPSSARLGEARDRLSVPANATMRAHLAGRADLTLVGPLDLAVTSASSELVVLALGRGVLVGDYDGARGGTLRVRSGDVTVEVVGTLFAVEARAEGTRVSVAHGKVRVERAGEIFTLTGGQSWSTGSPRPEPLPRQVSRLFDRAPDRSAGGPAGGAARSSVRPAASPAVAAAPRTAPEPAPGTTPPHPARPAPTAPAATVVPPAPVTAASLYRLVESALQAGDDGRAHDLLAELVARFPADPAADAARFELALTFEKAGKPDQAFALTEAILRGRARGPFVGPARLLRCRVARAYLASHPEAPGDSAAVKVRRECDAE
jgi:hypothetical protein